MSINDERKNLSELAYTHVNTEQFQINNKSLSLSHYIISYHEFNGSNNNGGYDWYIIIQKAILNGGAGYDYHWAGTRQKVNGESWYVGQGDVCLNYIDHYHFKNYFSNQDTSVELISSKPEAKNDTSVCTITEGFNASGTIGFEIGSEKKGSSSLSLGGNFENSYSFNIEDCSVENNSLSTNLAISEWTYTFKKAMQNTAAGKWQHLFQPAKLAYSTFSPINIWIWKIPTSKREQFKKFQTEVSLGIMNTITRYSGSQSPKHIQTKTTPHIIETSLPLPPLLSTNKNTIEFSNKGGMKKLLLASQGKWNLIIDKTLPWIRSNISEGNNTHPQEIYISVDKLPKDSKERIGYITISNDTTSIKIDIVQSLSIVE